MRTEQLAAPHFSLLGADEHGVLGCTFGSERGGCAQRKPEKP